MIWGTFTKEHLVSLALATLVNVLIYLILSRNTRSKQIIALFLFSLFGAGVMIYNIVANSGDIWRNLPLSFMAFNMLLLPFAVLFRERQLCNLLLIWSGTSFIALVFNYDMAHLEILSFEFLIYFTMHMFGAGIPILLFELNLVKRDTRTVFPTLVITFFTYTAVHLANLVINSANGWPVMEGVNYMSTLAPDSSLLNFFHAIIPSPYWYMILALPLILLYMLYWYLPEILDDRRRRKPLRAKLRDIDKFYEEYEEEYIEEIIDKKYRY